jgi:hypothetical protein
VHEDEVVTKELKLAFFSSQIISDFSQVFLSFPALPVALLLRREGMLFAPRDRRGEKKKKGKSKSNGKFFV